MKKIIFAMFVVLATMVSAQAQLVTTQGCDRLTWKVQEWMIPEVQEITVLNDQATEMRKILEEVKRLQEENSKLRAKSENLTTALDLVIKNNAALQVENKQLRIKKESEQSPIYQGYQGPFATHPSLWMP